jgi:hypothetical protein
VRLVSLRRLLLVLLLSAVVSAARATSPVSADTSFSTSIPNGGTITTPYIWTFNPNDPLATRGYFFIDRVRVALVGTKNADGSFSWTIPAGEYADGVHTFGHGWDDSDGTHLSGPVAYTATISNATRPESTTPPTIAGAPMVGQTLTGSQAGWTNQPLTVTDQWFSCDAGGTACTAAGGATSLRYVVQADDVGRSFVLRETATNANGSTTTDSAATSAVVSGTAYFTTSLTGVTSITTPYTWTFDPGVPSSSGSFFIDGVRHTIAGPPPYRYTIQVAELASGVSHTFGHAWDFNGVHYPGPHAYSAVVADPAPAPTWDQEVAYTNSRPGFVASRTIAVDSASGLLSALANLKPGDYVKATAPFTVRGETIIDKQLSAPAVVDLGTGANAVHFVYDGGQNLPAVWLNHAANIRFYGGDLTTASTGGSGLLMHGGTNILWWYFRIHDCGGSGLAGFNTAPFSGNDLYGEITHSGLQYAWDPHAEKGSGMHGAIFEDAGSLNAFTNNRIALYVHDQPSGAALEWGNSQAGAPSDGNLIYLKAVNLTFKSLLQTGGNALQLWGGSTLGAEVAYLEVVNTQGRAVDCNGCYDASGTGTASGVTVDYAVASSTNQNWALNEPYNTLPYDWRGGVRYLNVTPTPTVP